MPEPISESNLLALIEGTLPPERAAEIDALVRADPALRARIEHMAADRATLARLPDALPAPSRTAEFAMRRAAETTATADRAPASAHPSRTAMLAAAAVGIVILGGVLAFIVNATHPRLRADRVAEATPDLTGKLKLAPTEDESAPIGPEPEAEETEEAPATNTAEDIAAKIAEYEADTAPDPLLDSFLSNIPEAPGSAAGPHSLAPAEIAELLRQGTLAVRITIDPSVPPGTVDHASAAGADPPDAKPAPVPPSMPIDIPDGAPDAEVLAALDRAVEPLRARSGYRVEFVRAPSAADADPALALNPKTVLWWSASPGQWRTVRTRTVPVLVTPEPATPAAQPQPASG